MRTLVAGPRLTAGHRACLIPGPADSMPSNRDLPVADPELIAELVAFAGVLADVARTETLRRFRTHLKVESKPGEGENLHAVTGFDPVTEADRAAEHAMRARIAAHYPEHGVEGEEFPPVPAVGPWSWTLDPIDGTRAFISGIPLWGVLIALSFHGRPIIGIIDQPYLDERYIGFPGGALARIRGQTDHLHIRDCERMDHAILATSDPFLFKGAEDSAFSRLREKCRLTRFGTDCYSYALVASGHIDLVAESGLKPWDVRALIPVVEGAGGIITNWRGMPAQDGGQVLAAGDPRMHAEALVHLRRAATKE